MDLFHVSSEPLSTNLVVFDESKSQTAPRRHTVEEAFLSHKPAAALDRLTALFAFGNLADAFHYAEAERRLGKPIHGVYRVVMETCERHPMAIVGAVEERLNQNGTVEALILEYWHPSGTWRFWEYLSEEMIVEEEVDAPAPHLIGGAGYRYHRDRDDLLARWPLNSSLWQ